MDGAAKLWRGCAEGIREHVSEGVWLSTFSMVEPLRLTDDSLFVAVPSMLVKDRLRGRYGSLVRNALDDAGCRSVDLFIEVHAGMPDDLDEMLAAGNPDATLETTAEQPPPRPARLDTHDEWRAAESARVAEAESGALNDRYTFDTFVTGQSNRFAQAAALSVAETPAQSYNPLFVYGDAGLGKTHLLQAIGNYVLENYPNMTVRYVSTETFMNEFVDAIAENTRQGFKRRYRQSDVLLVDDIQFMEGKEGLQEEFFHTFNTLHQADRQIVISSDRTPDAIATLEDRLRSRFKMGLITDIQPPDLETRLAILRRKADREGVAIPDEVLEFIAGNITDNIRELEGALIRICAKARVYDLPLTLEVAQGVLHPILAKREPRPITPEGILSATADEFGFSIEEICGHRRHRPLVTARQIAMYVMREKTTLSFPAIARHFSRDHTTVIHAVDKISRQMAERPQIYEQVTNLIEKLTKGTE